MSWDKKTFWPVVGALYFRGRHLVLTLFLFGMAVASVWYTVAHWDDPTLSRGEFFFGLLFLPIVFVVYMVAQWISLSDKARRALNQKNQMV